MNIDQALIALCRKHDLDSLSVAIIASDKRAAGFFFSACAQYIANGKRNGASAIEPTATEAIAHAIQQVNEARACVVEVPAMELGEVVL